MNENKEKNDLDEVKLRHTWGEFTEVAYKSLGSKARTAANAVLAFMILANIITDLWIYRHSIFSSLLRIIQLIGIYGSFKFMIWAALPNTKEFRRISTLVAMGAGVSAFNIAVIKGSSLLILNTFISVISFIVGIGMIPVMLFHLLYFLAERLEDGTKYKN
ncbi:MAG TPA: hypothetical protein VEG39_05205 [Clostridia bacterium]|nr:hypothetical protein [Clostridia bacterium]